MTREEKEMTTIVDGKPVTFERTLPDPPCALCGAAPPSAWQPIARLGAELVKQDNHCTAHPIFVVQQRRRIYGLDPAYVDECVWISADESIEADAAETATLNAQYEETGREPDNWIRTAYIDSWEFVTACLTQAGADAYISSQRHNLKEPRVYVESGYRNREWIGLREALKALAPPRVSARPRDEDRK